MLSGFFIGCALGFFAFSLVSSLVAKTRETLILDDHPFHLVGLHIRDRALKSGEVLNSTASAPERGNAFAFCEWTPTFAGTYTVQIEVNPGRSVIKNNYTNNSFEYTLEILPAYDSPDRDDDDDDDPHDPGDDRDPHGPADKKPDGFVYPVPSTGENTDTLTWEENGTTYWARLNFNVSFSEPEIDPMRSGYGFKVSGTAEITHNYYDDARVREPEGIIMLLPEYNYERGVNLERMPDGTWQLPVNPESVTGARRWYIPGWYADGQQYTVVSQCYGSHTPAGELTSAKQC